MVKAGYPMAKNCALTVIPVEGWKHGQPYSLPVKPSPNLPNDQAIALYPSLCPFEGTAISVAEVLFILLQVIGSPDIRISSFLSDRKPWKALIRIRCIKIQYCYGNNLRHITAPKGILFKIHHHLLSSLSRPWKADKFFTATMVRPVDREPYRKGTNHERSQ